MIFYWASLSRKKHYETPLQRFRCRWQQQFNVKLIRILCAAILEISQRKQTSVLIIGEAYLLRIEIFAQLHAISQFDMDSKPLLPIVLAGQNKLTFHTSKPLASRIISRSHLERLKHKDMTGYIKHHLKIAGINEQLFSDEVILAINQGYGGLLRLANLPVKGALTVAAHEQCQVVLAEHIRIASTEII